MPSWNTVEAKPSGRARLTGASAFVALEEAAFAAGEVADGGAPAGGAAAGGAEAGCVAGGCAAWRQLGAVAISAAAIRYRWPRIAAERHP
jgi:hypothetical protein